MPYIVNKSNGTELVVLEDGTLDTTTSIGLIGRNYSGYGEIQNENFLFLLENFASERAPARPLEGQIWYDSANQKLNVYDKNGWTSVGSANVSLQPPTASPGNLWFKTNTNQLFVYQNGTWNLIGPEAVENFGQTRMLSDVLFDTEGDGHAIIKILVNDFIVGIISSDTFDIAAANTIDGFSRIFVGVNLNSLIGQFTGSLRGNADTATALESPRTINGVVFDGRNDITIRSETRTVLTRGTYLLGADFNGSTATTWSVDATPNNTIGKVVARDSTGSFYANMVYANTTGIHTGNVNSTTGRSTFNILEANEVIGSAFTGNASSATRLQTARQINGVLFDGTSNVTIPSEAFSLTGTRLAPNVIDSDLTTLGTLLSLRVADAGVSVGSANDLKISINSQNGVDLTVDNSKGIVFSVKDDQYGTGYARFKFINSTTSLDEGGAGFPSIVPVGTVPVNIGSTSNRFSSVYAESVSATTLNTSVINTSDPQNVVTMTSNVIIDGNLIVNGLSTIINSNETFIDDILLTLAAGSVSPSEANGAGLIIDGANAQLFYSVNGDKWNINKDIDAGSFSFIGTATAARYADLAENYLADKKYDFGTVLEFGGPCEVKLAEDNTRKIAGVVSQNPAYLMNKDLVGENVVPLALQGRVFCKVKGKISKGDLLISAGNGYAKSCDDPKIGSVLGKSLEDFDGDSGMIEIVVGRI